MRAGELRHLVTALRRVVEPDGAGGQREGWIPIAPFWASIEPTYGRHGFRGLAEGMRVSHLIRARWQPGLLNGADRIRYGTRTFRVLGVRDMEERHRELIIAAEELAEVAE